MTATFSKRVADCLSVPESVSLERQTRLKELQPPRLTSIDAARSRGERRRISRSFNTASVFRDTVVLRFSVFSKTKEGQKQGLNSEVKSSLLGQRRRRAMIKKINKRKLGSANKSSTREALQCVGELSSRQDRWRVSRINCLSDMPIWGTRHTFALKEPFGIKLESCWCKCYLRGDLCVGQNLQLMAIVCSLHCCQQGCYFSLFSNACDKTSASG